MLVRPGLSDVQELRCSAASAHSALQVTRSQPPEQPGSRSRTSSSCRKSLVVPQTKIKANENESRVWMRRCRGAVGPCGPHKERDISRLRTRWSGLRWVQPWLLAALCVLSTHVHTCPLMSTPVRSLFSGPADSSAGRRRFIPLSFRIKVISTLSR